MKQVKSSNTWHLIIRTDDDSQVEQLHEEISLLMSEFTFHRILIGTERGKKHNKYHAHCTYLFPETLSDTTMRKRLKQVITLPIRLSIVKDLTKSLKYTIKGQEPYAYSMYSPEDIKIIQDSWLPQNEYQKQTGLIATLLPLINLDTDTPEQILNIIIDHYHTHNKIFDQFKLQSLMVTILSRKQKYRTQLIDNVLQKINLY